MQILEQVKHTQNHDIPNNSVYVRENRDKCCWAKLKGPS